MQRVEIINTVGASNLVSNIENGEFSYPKAFNAAHLDFEPICDETNRKFEKLDIRFVKDDLSVLIETKQNFNSNLLKAKKQLSAYVEYEKKLTNNKIVAILANTNNDDVMVWRGAVSDANLMTYENIIKRGCSKT